MMTGTYRINGAVEIKNVPPYAVQTGRWIVYRTVDDENWFWGAWEDPTEAEVAVNEVFGSAIKVLKAVAV